MNNSVPSIHFTPTYCLEMKRLHRYLSGTFLVVSSLVGLVAGIRQMALWARHLKHSEERRKPSSHPEVVFSLSLSNTIACCGLLFLGLGILIQGQFLKQDSEQRITQVAIVSLMIPVETLATLGFILSGWWTVIYLVDVCMQVHHRRSYLKVYYIVSWISSLGTLAALVTLRYDRGDVRACKSHRRMIHVVMCWLCLLLSFILISVVALYIVDRQVKADLYRLGNSYTRNQRGLMQKIRFKFVLLVSIFIACWIPTLAIGFISLIGAGLRALETFSYLETILNPLQASLNCLIFIPWRASKPVVPPLSERTSAVTANIQEVFGTSVASSIVGSMGISLKSSRSLSATAHFHFTPCPLEDDEDGPLLSPDMSTDNSDTFTCTTDSDHDEHTLVIGKLLGE